MSTPKLPPELPEDDSDDEDLPAEPVDLDDAGREPHTDVPPDEVDRPDPRLEKEEQA